MTFELVDQVGFLLQASTDQSALDLDVPNQLGNFAFLMIELLGIIAMMSQIAWQVFIVFVLVIATCIWLQVKSNKLISMCLLTLLSGILALLYNLDLKNLIIVCILTN